MRYDLPRHPALTGEDENDERDDRSPFFDLSGVKLSWHFDNFFVTGRCDSPACLLDRCLKWTFRT
jgi:hypothetical protein